MKTETETKLKTETKTGTERVKTPLERLLSTGCHQQLVFTVYGDHFFFKCMLKL